MKGVVRHRCVHGPQYKADTTPRVRIKCPQSPEHGSWEFVVDAGRDTSGKRRQIKQGGFRTKEAAEKAMRTAAKLADEGIVKPTRDQTFAKFAEAWLDAKARSPKVRPVTLTGYKSAINHALVAFGDRPVDKITYDDVQKIADDMADSGKAQRSVSFVMFALKGAFNEAIKRNMINYNPAALVDANGRAPKKRGAMSDADLVKLREHFTGDRLLACWLLSLHGLRRSEVMGLRWSDVDLTAGTLTIARSVTADVSGRRNEETGPKTRNGGRTLPLPDDLLTALRSLREQQATDFGLLQIRNGWLAVDEAGQPYRPERWSDAWRDHLKAAGVEPVTLHGARHTSVTSMRRAGVPDQDVAAHHGHSEAIMRSVYGHSDQVGMKAAGAALSAVLGGAS